MTDSIVKKMPVLDRFLMVREDYSWRLKWAAGCWTRMAMRATVLMIPLVALMGCSYGEVQTRANIDHAVAKPGTHFLALAVNFSRVQEPTGVLNTFPNGGVPRVVAHEARIYVVDVDRQLVTLAARMADFAGIPQPKAVRVEGWQDDALYFSLIGYGGDARTGDDLSDPRRRMYVVDASGRVERIDALPGDLVVEQTSGPLGRPPFLRLSKGHSSVDIGVDARLNDAEGTARLVLDPETGQPQFVNSALPGSDSP